MTDKKATSTPGVNAALMMRALSFSADKHRRQKRKDVDESPYILHPIAVATALAVEGNVTDETLLIAALLHDTVEDVGVTYEELVGHFDVEVANLVMEVTDDKNLPKPTRKALQVEHARHASDRAKQLKIADKTCNIRDIIQAPPKDWTLERCAEYLAWTKQVVDNCRGVNPSLEAVYDSVLQEGEILLDRGV